jgi:hypothetical protein
MRIAVFLQSRRIFVPVSGKGTKKPDFYNELQKEALVNENGFSKLTYAGE